MKSERFNVINRTLWDIRSNIVKMQHQLDESSSKYWQRSLNNLLKKKTIVDKKTLDLKNSKVLDKMAELDLERSVEELEKHYQSIKEKILDNPVTRTKDLAKFSGLKK